MRVMFSTTTGVLMLTDMRNKLRAKKQKTEKHKFNKTT